MNKKEMVAALTQSLHDDNVKIQPSMVATVLDYAMDLIMDTVADGDKVTFAGFGLFTSRDRAPRGARNPRTGEAVTIPARTVPAFKPGIEFKRRVDSVE